jgi:hypothetical protein
MKRIVVIPAILVFFSSCFKSYMKLDITNKWEHHKMKALAESKKEVELYFTNKPAVISDPVLHEGQILGALSTVESNRITRLSYAERENPSEFRKTVKAADVQIFISEEFHDQDTVVINSDNFLQMREYKIDRSATVLSFIGSTAGILTLIILIFGVIAYRACVTSTITLNL